MFPQVGTTSAGWSAAAPKAGALPSCATSRPPPHDGRRQVTATMQRTMTWLFAIVSKVCLRGSSTCQRDPVACGATGSGPPPVRRRGRRRGTPASVERASSSEETASAHPKNMALLLGTHSSSPAKWFAAASGSSTPPNLLPPSRSDANLSRHRQPHHAFLPPQ